MLWSLWRPCLGRCANQSGTCIVIVYGVLDRCDQPKCTRSIISFVETDTFCGLEYTEHVHGVVHGTRNGYYVTIRLMFYLIILQYHNISRGLCYETLTQTSNLASFLGFEIWAHIVAAWSTIHIAALQPTDQVCLLFSFVCGRAENGRVEVFA